MIGQNETIEEFLAHRSADVEEAVRKAAAAEIMPRFRRLAEHEVDQKSGQPYYVTRLKIADKLPPEIRPEQIYPGTLVEAFISTGDRTFIEYLGKPIMDSFYRAFREE